ncbi:hypothetical protein [Xanthomarina sp. F2636L]|uniref:hypothetical protein n=1 Tax=Xanthomarina sp. F2636L TaxID=2996018 RepID=UPI00225E4D41|nr:hypothetical protein [Xanthomarina sp. F2636L]MCX7550890.1 hypothetical protein [Xanthomarina sp. F2636L]
MSENYIGFEKFCELLSDDNILKTRSPLSVRGHLQECIIQIKSDVLLKLSKSGGSDDNYLEYLVHEINRLDFIPNFGVDNIQEWLDLFNINIKDVLESKVNSSEYFQYLDVILPHDPFMGDSVDILKKKNAQKNFLYFFINYHANELISFLESKKTTFIKKGDDVKEPADFENLDVYSKLLYLFKELEKIKVDIFREARNCGSAEAYHEIELKYEDNIDIIKSQILKIIDDLYSQSKEDNIYYFDCPSDVYIAHFSIRMSNYFKEIPEANELDFLKSEIKYFSDPKKNRVLKRNYNYSEFIGNTEKYKVTLRRKIEFLEPKLNKYSFKIISKEDEFLEDPYLGDSIVGTLIDLVKDENLTNIPQEKQDSISSVSFKFDKNSTPEEFQNLHVNNKYFQQYSNKNPDFLKELFEFIKDDNRPIKSTYMIFDKKINLYILTGYTLFFMKFSKASSVVINPASQKMPYLEELKKRKVDLSRIYNKQTLRDEIKHTYDLRAVYKQKFSDFFSYDDNLKNNAGSYAYILINSIERLLNTATIYFDDLTADQILGLNDNKLNIVKGEIENNFKAYHNLIKFISLNHTPYLEHQAVEFISNTIQSINKRNFEHTYLYDILEKEVNKISNEKVYEKILAKNKLLETHQFFIKEKPENEKSESNESENNDLVTDKKTIQYKSSIFLNQEAQEWFNNTLQELSAINVNNKPERSFQAICNAIFRDEKCKSIIFKNRLLLKNYITFLNDEYKAGIKSKSNLSNPQIYSIDVSDLINIYQNELLANKPE